MLSTYEEVFDDVYSTRENFLLPFHDSLENLC